MELGDYKDEIYVDDAMSSLCRPDRMNSYDYPPPRMFKGCNDFLMEHSDDIVNVMMDRTSNKLVEKELCFVKTKACIEEAEL